MASMSILWLHKCKLVERWSMILLDTIIIYIIFHLDTVYINLDTIYMN